MNFKEDSFMVAIALCVVFFVVAQALFFLVRAVKRAKELGISNQTIKNTIVSSSLFTIAPAIGIVATVLTLSAGLGYVLPWIRLSVIGNLAYETVAAEAALNVLGTSVSNEVTDVTQFSTIAWTMTIGSCFPLVLLPILCKKIHKAMGKVTQKSANAGRLGDILGAAAFIGIIAAFISRAIAGIPSDGPSAGIMSVATLLSAMIFTIALDYLCRKKELKKLEPFVLPIAMFGAMGIAVLLTQVLPPEIAALTWR